MRYFRTAHAPDECVRRIRLAVRAERGSRELVEGWVLGRTFRLALQEPITNADDAGRGMCDIRTYQGGRSGKRYMCQGVCQSAGPGTVGNDAAVLY